MLKVKIAPSILSANFGKLNSEISDCSNADLIHVDVMDGHFVPNITIGPAVVKHIKTNIPLDVHLMISEPEKYYKDFIKAGASIITFHVEACPGKKAVELIKNIQSKGVKAGIVLNPDTSIDKIKDLLALVDMVLVMSVYPGFGSQKFIPVVLDKIRKLRKLKPNLDIEIDGGINFDTVELAAEAGVNVIVAGSFIFNSNKYNKTIDNLRELAEKHFK